MMIRRTTDAMQFLTIIPMGRNNNTSVDDLGECLSYFPVAGFILGIGITITACVLAAVMSPAVISIFVLSFYVVITGGFHQDGLSDTFDALSIKSSDDSSKDRERRLRVMKDSTIGPMGVAAVALSLLMKYVLIEAILQHHLAMACAVLLLLPVVSKWAMVIGMYHTKPAVRGGLGGLFVERIRIRHIALASVFLCCLAAASYVFLSMLSDSLTVKIVLILPVQILFVALVILMCKRVFTNRFGGLTGDNFGALHEFAEIMYLTLAVALM